MKIISFFVISIFLYSCESGPYVKHTLAVEKKGSCSQSVPNSTMTSNINGERFEFYYCLPDNFTEKDFTIRRSGDSLITNLSDIKMGDKTALFKLTLDVDAYPRYNSIKLGENVVGIVPAY